MAAPPSSSPSAGRFSLSESFPKDPLPFWGRDLDALVPRGRLYGGKSPEPFSRYTRPPGTRPPGTRLAPIHASGQKEASSTIVLAEGAPIAPVQLINTLLKKVLRTPHFPNGVSRARPRIKVTLLKLPPRLRFPRNCRALSFQGHESVSPKPSAEPHPQHHRLHQGDCYKGRTRPQHGHARPDPALGGSSGKPRTWTWLCLLPFEGPVPMATAFLVNPFLSPEYLESTCRGFTSHVTDSSESD